MSKKWELLIKPAFLDYLLKLPSKEVKQVRDKVEMLEQNPLPDGKLKKQLIYMPGRPYRIRSGDYRIFYTFQQDVVCIYKMDDRDDDTYSDTVAPEAPPSSDVLAALDVEHGDAASSSSPRVDWDHAFDSAINSKPLPEPITVELLTRLRVPEQYHARLLRVRDQDRLLSCPGVPDEILLRIDGHMFDPPMEQVIQQPNLVLSDTEDLLRYKEGELLTFLLKLSPDQERYASWSMGGTGPTLVKGGPGTGKSTVALYRIRSLLNQLQANGQAQPRILFTTYTNALIRSSQQLLKQLLGPNHIYVEVATADSIIHKFLRARRQENLYQIESGDQPKKLLTRAIGEVTFNGNQLQQQAQQQILQRMGGDYLMEEIEKMIIARQLGGKEEYVKASRSGRKLRLNATQRTAVWKVYERWLELMKEQGIETFALRRLRAARLLGPQVALQQYDAVVIDEAQDLDPTALRVLVAYCKAPNRLFITADANQSIYGSGFSWSEVHESLRFQGRTCILKANYRSTAEIGEAAQSYLSHGALEPEVTEPQYINNGPTPDARMVAHISHEAQLLTAYFKQASRSLRLPIGSCAVLCPNENAGRALAIALENQGLEATYMSGRELDLSRPGIKVITLKSSKGLEFPIVALAGFTSTNYPIIPADASDEQRAELLAGERRTLFVGMTRAMRALIVIIPQGATTPLLDGFDPKYWNLTRKI
ncbi:UvrD-helicase domain-containing protein [Dictyobacter formicarum]|uniref:DNA 3'-5' helicase n=1 Tax=Dictyobacter formicarum TaxID=2778368 RepID=A0ABQ3VSC8_9CHLR|nr:UvrD-helicase domain-containing protein [Dictyobacter formicarum]GHO89187.1 DNA helicase [Dictyobacter formicarum]